MLVMRANSIWLRALVPMMFAAMAAMLAKIAF
jgi:hypothetical protein